MKLDFFHAGLSRVRALPPRWQRTFIAVAAVLAALALFGLGMLTGHRAGLPHGAGTRVLELNQSNQELRDQLAVLQRDRQVTQIADRELQRNLAERDEEIRGLRADQAFYSKLVGADAQPGGLTVHGVTLTPIARTRAWNFTVTLTRSAESAKQIEGRLSIAVEGIRADKLDQLDWTQLGGPAGSDGLPFAFKYFQQVRGTLMLPPGFTPNRIRVTLDPKGSAAVTRTLAWSDALRGNTTVAGP